MSNPKAVQTDSEPGAGQPAPGRVSARASAKAGAAGLPGGVERKAPAGAPAAGRAAQAPDAAALVPRGGAASSAGREAAAKVPPPVAPTRPRRRHGFIALLFVMIVVAPLAVAAWYLYTRADDQYASTLGFSVRSEEGPSASELLGNIANMSSGSSTDTDVLNEFMQSQDLVERVDARLDLRSIYSKPEDDPVFALDPDATIEDLVRYWNRAVTLYYDGTQGLIEARVLAFDPADAQAVARAVFEESSQMINALTDIARADATAYARRELDIAVDRLKAARTAMTEFRTRTQIVDPNADVQGQMGLLNNLQAQLAESLIELDLLRETTRDTDPRIRQTEQRIAVIEKRIDEERAKFGVGGSADSGEDYASLIGEYESLLVDREFAERSYLTAQTNYDAALAEAQRKSRYLAAHVPPTLAQEAQYPRREIILLTLALFCFVAWATLSLIYYSIKDRR